MPYIAINTTQKLTITQKEKIKTRLGHLITIIPTKAEATTMIDFSDDRTMFKGGENISGAFIELRLFHKADFDTKKQFTEETFELFTRELGITKANMYLNIIELENRGSTGTLKT